jgi:hypothetical protein
LSFIALLLHLLFVLLVLRIELRFFRLNFVYGGNIEIQVFFVASLMNLFLQNVFNISNDPIIEGGGGSNN